MVAIYQALGFTSIDIVVENAFAPIAEVWNCILLQITLNVTSKDEHEPRTEKFIMTLKE